MKLSIYEVYVNIEDQAQADRMKQICIDYGLPIWDDVNAFWISKSYKYFSCNSKKEFFIRKKEYNYNKTQVTESEFLELVKMLNKC